MSGRIEGFRRERGQTRQPLDLSNGGEAVARQSPPMRGWRDIMTFGKSRRCVSVKRARNPLDRNRDLPSGREAAFGHLRSLR